MCPRFRRKSRQPRQHNRSASLSLRAEGHPGQSSHATYEFSIAGEHASSAAKSSTPRKPLETDLVTATSLTPLTAKYHISSPFLPLAGPRLAISVCLL